MNTDTKSILASKTVWGVVIAALPTLVGFFGYNIGDVAGFTAQASNLVDGIIALVGSAVAVYGRLVATSRLVVKK